jgi:hypothetical protein
VEDLDRPSALDDSDQENYNRNNQQNVNVSAERVGTDHSQQPEGQEKDEDKHQHFVSPFRQRSHLQWASTFVEPEVPFSCPLFLKACRPGKAKPAISNNLPVTLPAGA